MEGVNNVKIIVSNSGVSNPEKGAQVLEDKINQWLSENHHQITEIHSIDTTINIGGAHRTDLIMLTTIKYS